MEGRRRFPGQSLIRGAAVPNSFYRGETPRTNRLLGGLTETRRALRDVESTVLSEALVGFFAIKHMEKDIELRKRVGEERYNEMIESAGIHLLTIEHIWDALKPQDNLRARLQRAWDWHLEVKSRK